VRTVFVLCVCCLCIVCVLCVCCVCIVCVLCLCCVCIVCLCVVYVFNLLQEWCSPKNMFSQIFLEDSFLVCLGWGKFIYLVMSLGWDPAHKK
jgi:hypothetical protein